MLEKLIFPHSPTFLQSSHLQCSPQLSPAWKHSQYFFKQADLRQLHPFACCSASNFGLKASGFLSIKVSIALFLSTSYSSVLWHPTQLHSSPQTWFSLKQSQYNFRHLVFLQLQNTFRLFGVFAADFGVKQTFFFWFTYLISCSLRRGYIFFYSGFSGLSWWPSPCFSY